MRALRDPGGGSTDVGAGRDDDGVLATELQRHRNQVLCGGPLHQGADGRRTGEEQMVEG
jgi:hypothetical protein